MKQSLLLYILISFVLCSYGQTVYVCSGGTTSKYHINKDCRGLSNCSGSIKITTVAAMTKQGRGACKICSDGVVSSASQKSKNGSSNNNSRQTTVIASKTFNTVGLELPTTAQGIKSQVIKHVHV